MNGADCQNSIKTCTDPIKAEIAKIQPKFDLQLKSRKLTALVKEINKMIGGYGGFVKKDGLEIMVYGLDAILNITTNPKIKRVSTSIDWPFELSKVIGGVRYYALINRTEWRKWAKDNSICVECGKDLTEYSDHDQNEEKLFYGCKDCRTGEATGRAV